MVARHKDGAARRAPAGPGGQSGSLRVFEATVVRTKAAVEIAFEGDRISIGARKQKAMFGKNKTVRRAAASILPLTPCSCRWAWTR